MGWSAEDRSRRAAVAGPRAVTGCGDAAFAVNGSDREGAAGEATGRRLVRRGRERAKRTMSQTAGFELEEGHRENHATRQSTVSLPQRRSSAAAQWQHVLFHAVQQWHTDLQSSSSYF